MSPAQRPGRVTSATAIGFRFCTVFAMFATAVTLSACERELSDLPPPLRPLVYTEAPPEPDAVEPPIEPPPSYIAPEDLGVAIYQALIEHDRELFERVFVSGPDLVALINAAEDKADADAAGFLEGSENVWHLFLPAEPSEEPVGGLTARLRLLEFEVGKGRDVSGKVAQSGDDVVMHWNSELRLQLRDTDKVFSLRVPKIVKTARGWKVMSELGVDNTLRTWLESGMHLKRELLTSEHYALPLEVGNFWKYRIDHHGAPRPRREPPPVELDENGEPVLPAEGADAPVQLEPIGDPTVRVTIIEVTRRDGYLVATLETEINDLEIEVSTARLLVTPRRVYRCARDCYAHLDDVTYLLGYIAHQTPVYVFPIETGTSWGKAGRSSEHDPYKVKPELHRATVPAGDFAEALVITGSIEEGLEERYFVPGTGIVKRTIRSGLGQRTEELIEFRLML